MIAVGRARLSCADVEAVAAGRKAVQWPERPVPDAKAASGPVPSVILARCVGVGPPLPPEEVRAIVVARAAGLARDGRVHRQTIDGLLHMLADGPLPVLPSRGDPGGLHSVMLAHLGRAIPFRGTDQAARTFISGTWCTAALGALAVERADTVIGAFERAGSLTGFLVTGGTSITEAGPPLQAAQRTIDAARKTVESALVDGDRSHAAVLTSTMDQIRSAVVQVAVQSERRAFRLTDGQLSDLPSFLVTRSGIQSGLMLAQYTAASLVSEMRTMAQPVSIDSVPTEGHREDWTSFGPGAARAALATVDLAADVAAIELLCAAQACDLARRDAPEPARSVYRAVRARVAFRDTDRVLHPDIAALGKAVREGGLRREGPGPEAPRSGRP